MANVTGRDRHIIMSALSVAIASIDRVPDQRQTPGSDRSDMEALFDALCGSAVETEIYTSSAERLLEKVRSLGSS